MSPLPPALQRSAYLVRPSGSVCTAARECLSKVGLQGPHSVACIMVLRCPQRRRPNLRCRPRCRPRQIPCDFDRMGDFFGLLSPVDGVPWICGPIAARLRSEPTVAASGNADSKPSWSSSDTGEGCIRHGRGEMIQQETDSTPLFGSCRFEDIAASKRWTGAPGQR